MILRFTALVISLIGILFAIPSIASVNLEDQRNLSVPKGLDDIVVLISNAQSDVALNKKDAELVSATPQSNLGKEDLFAFYYLRAQAAERLGRIDLRISSLEEASRYADPNAVNGAITARELAYAQSSAGRPLDAIKILLNAEPKIPSAFWGIGIGLNSHLSKIYSSIGEFDKAHQYMVNAESGVVRGRGGLTADRFLFAWRSSYFSALGDLYYYQGKFHESEIAIRQALESLEGGIDTYAAGYTGTGVPANNYGATGNPNSMRAQLEQLYLLESDLLLKLRKINESEYYAREGLKKSLKRTGRDSIYSAMAMRQLAIVMLARDRNKDALYLLNQALASMKQAGVYPEAIELAKTNKTMASALIANDQYDQALKIYSDLDKTIQDHPDLGRFLDTNSLDRVLALVRVGDLLQAETRARDFLKATEKRTGQKSKETADAKLMLATVLASQKKDVEARQLFATGMGELIALEREVATDSEGLSSKEKKYLAAYIESYLGVLARAYEKSPTLAIASEAFVLGDLARSSGVQKALNASTARANITNPRLAELARKEQDLNQQITFLTRFAKELAMQPANQQLPEVQKKMRADIEQLREEAKVTIRSIEIDFPEYAELISPKPASLERVQKNLKANEVMVTWFIGQTSSYVWAIDSSGNPQFKTLNLTQANLRKDINTLRKALDPQVTTVEEVPAFHFALSYQLYKALIDPIQSALEGKNTLVLVPHDEIGQLPLGVLITANFVPNPKADLRFSNYREAPWLIKKYALVTVPSATALTSLRSLPKPKEGRLDYIAFGDPLFNTEQAKVNEKMGTNPSTGTQLASRGVPLKLRNSPNTAQVSSAEVSILPRLPDTNDEIQEIAKVFNVDPKRDIYVQKRANLDEVLKANLANRRVVMFSTHGLVPGELNGLTQPALALTNPEVLGQKGDGLLKVDQILTLKLNADWVVLSACNTAAGEGEGAEALSGLGRAFFYAGARSLLVSSWPVDSQASRKLMTDLFKRQNLNQELSKPQALQQASLYLINEGRPDAMEENYSYAHPLFWAPFMMVGN